MSRSLRRLAVTAVSTAAVSLVALAPSPALASDFFFSKSSGTFAQVDWLEVGPLPPEANALGNAHFGFLTVEQTGRGVGSAFGYVVDAQCPEGGPYELPGGGHGPDAPPSPCTEVGFRKMSGRSLSFTMDKKYTKATLTGTLEVGAHGSTSVGTPPVDITWTGVGVLRTRTESAQYSDEFGTGTFRYRSTSRDGVIAAGSRIGPMVFDDEAREYSVSSLGSFRAMSRDRS